MRNSESKRTIHSKLLGGVLASFLALTVLAGCSESESDLRSDGLTGPDGDAQFDASLAPPTMNELASVLSLTEAEADGLSPLLASWRANRASWNEAIHAEHEGTGATVGQSPMMTFLAEGSRILSRENFVQMVEFLAARQQLQRESRMEARKFGGRGRSGRLHEGGGKHGHGGDLDLTEDQRTALGELRRVYHEEMKTLHSALREDKISPENFRDSYRTLLEKLDAETRVAIGAEAFEKLKAHKLERRVMRAERQLERMSDHSGRRVEFLTQVLSLSESQTTELTAIFAGAHEDRAQVLQQVIDGTIDRPDVMYARIIGRQESDAAVSGVLTPDQLEIYEALKKLHRGSRGRHHAA